MPVAIIALDICNAWLAQRIATPLDMPLDIFMEKADGVFNPSTAFCHCRFASIAKCREVFRTHRSFLFFQKAETIPDRNGCRCSSSES
jgi:hypothetical protein